MIEALLKAGAERQLGQGQRHHRADDGAASGNADAVKVLLDHGADVNAKESAHGQTALMFAAALNRADVGQAAARSAEPIPTSRPRCASWSASASIRTATSSKTAPAAAEAAAAEAAPKSRGRRSRSRRTPRPPKRRRAKRRPRRAEPRAHEPEDRRLSLIAKPPRPAPAMSPRAAPHASAPISWAA